MPKGDLLLQITGLTGEPVRERVTVELQRFSGQAGTGGENMEVTASLGGATDLHITGITCRGGPGTMYVVTASIPHHRLYRFHQLIQENRVNTASDDVAFWVKPGDVRDIRGPAFGDLAAGAQAILSTAAMVREKPEDADLVGLAGTNLYRQLGPKRKACLLNIIKKAGHRATSDDSFRFVESLLVCRQDRFFAMVAGGMPEHLRQSPVYKSAPNTLHDPLDGFELAEGSFKTRDAHANLQVTFMRHKTSGRLAADIDIDESSGIEHGFEVIRNAVFQQRTNPYLIREFMLAADREQTLDPGYRFVF